MGGPVSRRGRPPWTLGLGPGDTSGPGETTVETWSSWRYPPCPARHVPPQGSSTVLVKSTDMRLGPSAPSSSQGRRRLDLVLGRVESEGPHVSCKP